MHRKTCWLLVCLGLTAWMLSGQSTSTGSLAGTVTDKSGAVVSGAAVKISSKESGLARETKTGEAGLYRFDLLPAGTYELTTAMPGFATATVQNVGLSVGQTTTIDVSLAPSAQAQTVTVEAGGAPLLDTSKSDL